MAAATALVRVTSLTDLAKLTNRCLTAGHPIDRSIAWLLVQAWDLISERLLATGSLMTAMCGAEGQHEMHDEDLRMSGEGPLAGVRVVDLTTTLMGPYCALLFAQLGADVIKVERPGGDLSRHIGDDAGVGLGAMYVNINRGKRSVELDLSVAADRDVLTNLIDHADVFAHNLRPASAVRLGLTYEQVGMRNHGLIYCSMHGFDERGPWRDKPAYDDIIQAASGIATVQGGRDGEPAYVRSAIADKTVGLFAFSAILAALYERASSGSGQTVEVPMFETMAAFTAIEQMGGVVFDPPTGPIGYARMESPHRRPYATADGYIAVMVYTDRQWAAFFELIGRRDLAADPRFAAIGGRTHHIDELYSLVASLLPLRTTAEWLDALDAADIPAAPVLNIEEVMFTTQAIASGLFEAVDHPVLGRLRQPGMPVTFGRTPPAAATPAATLGADTGGIRDATADGAWRERRYEPPTANQPAMTSISRVDDVDDFAREQR